VQYEIGVAVLTGISVSALGGAGLVAVKARNEARRARERALPGAEGQDVIADRGAHAPRFVGAVQKVGEAVGAKRASGGLAQQLARAGYFRPSAPAVYLGTKMLLFAVGLVVFGLVAGSLNLSLALRIALVGFGSLMLFFLPNVVVGIRRDRRKAEIQRHLPDAIDLLEICVSAGMGLDTAWNSVAADIRRVSTTLADEMELTNLEISLGATRATAMRNMSNRTGVEEISSLVALLVQSDRFGASIVDALRVFAKSMREMRTQRAEESAEKMAVKMLFPMVLFIFPTLLIVMVGPAAVEIFNVMIKK